MPQTVVIGMKITASYCVRVCEGEIERYKDRDREKDRCKTERHRETEKEREIQRNREPSLGLQ